jgi:CBS domain containing-hemolysin-like protein
MIKKILIMILAIGLGLAIISVFGDPFKFFSWVFDWIVWSIDAVKDIFTGSRTFNNIAKTTPNDLSLIVHLIIGR